MNDIEKKKQALRDELDTLKHEFNVDLPQKIAEARAHGDLKENADYHAARERQGFVKAKIAQLSAELAKLSSVDVGTIPHDRVGLGSQVVLADESGSTLSFTFVTESEVDPAEGKITLSTPYGRALVGKMAGESLQVALPVGERTFVLKKLITVHGDEFSA